VPGLWDGSEIILPGAFDGVLGDDVIACFNHNESAILARSKDGKGSLKLSVDSVGLHYEFEAPNTTTGNDLLESIKRGDINASSFAFTVGEGGDIITQESGGTLRTIRKVSRLYDVSAVSRPAYSAATVSARAHERRTTGTPVRDGFAKMFQLLSK
jgi:HK97 family phage prohead protease